jgi:DNA-binding MarR family transcriptional regulator
LVANATTFCDTAAIAWHGRPSTMGSEREADAKGHAWAMLLVAHARLIERIEAALAAAALPPLGWYDVLWALESAAGRQLRMHQLAEHVVLSRSNLTRLADRLEEAGLLERVAATEDRRGAYCVITTAGRALRKRMWPVYRDAVETYFGSHLSEREAVQIGEILARVARAVHTAPRAAAAGAGDATPRRSARRSAPAVR